MLKTGIIFCALFTLAVSQDRPPMVVDNSPTPIRFQQMGQTKVKLGDAHIITTIPIFGIAQNAISLDTLLDDILSQDIFNDEGPVMILKDSTYQSVVHVKGVIDSLGISGEFQHYHAVNNKDQKSADLTKALAEAIKKDPTMRERRVRESPSNNPLVGQVANATVGLHQPGKRFVGALLMGLAGIGIAGAAAMGAFTTAQLSHLQDQVETTNQRVNDVTHAVVQLDNIVKQHEKAMNKMHSQFLDSYRDMIFFEDLTALALHNVITVQHLSDVIAAAKQGTAHPTLFTAVGLHQAIGNLTLRTSDLALEPITTNPAEVTQMPTSYLYDKRSKDIKVFLHLPLTNDRHTMHIHAITSMPFKTETGYFQITPEQKYIATSTQAYGGFFAMSDLEFSKCVKLNSQYVCPHQRTLMRATNTVSGINGARCLHAALKDDENGIKEHCEVREVENIETVEAISNTEFVIFSSSATILKLRCTSGERSTQAHQGLAHVSIRPGCSVETYAHYVWPELSIDVEIPEAKSPFQITSVIKAFGKLSNGTLERARGMKESIGYHMKYDREALDDLEKTSDLKTMIGNHPGISTAIVALVAVAITLLATFFVYKYKTKGRTHANTDSNQVARFDAGAGRVSINVGAAQPPPQNAANTTYNNSVASNGTTHTLVGPNNSQQLPQFNGDISSHVGQQMRRILVKAAEDITNSTFDSTVDLGLPPLASSTASALNLPAPPGNVYPNRQLKELGVAERNNL